MTGELAWNRDGKGYKKGMFMGNKTQPNGESQNRARVLQL